jgi:hypothetical protein
LLKGIEQGLFQEKTKVAVSDGVNPCRARDRDRSARNSRAGPCRAIDLFRVAHLYCFAERAQEFGGLAAQIGLLDEIGTTAGATQLVFDPSVEKLLLVAGENIGKCARGVGRHKTSDSDDGRGGRTNSFDLTARAEPCPAIAAAGAKLIGRVCGSPPEHRALLRFRVAHPCTRCWWR